MKDHPPIDGHISGKHGCLVSPLCLFPLIQQLLLPLIYCDHLPGPILTAPIRSLSGPWSSGLSCQQF